MFVNNEALPALCNLSCQEHHVTKGSSPPLNHGHIDSLKRKDKQHQVFFLRTKFKKEISMSSSYS